MACTTQVPLVLNIIKLLKKKKWVIVLVLARMFRVLRHRITSPYPLHPLWVPLSLFHREVSLNPVASVLPQITKLEKTLRKWCSPPVSRREPDLHNRVMSWPAEPNLSAQPRWVKMAPGSSDFSLTSHLTRKERSYCSAVLCLKTMLLLLLVFLSLKNCQVLGLT